jgi:PAS domain S-box-containing protein
MFAQRIPQLAATVAPNDNFRSTLSDEARYRLLVEAVTDYAIYMLDPHGIVVSWNPGAQRLKGYTEAEILGHHFSRFYLEEDRRAGGPARTLATATRENRFEAEGWRVRKDGSRFWAHVVVDPIRAASGELLGFAKVTRDLSERKHAAETLRRSEEQFKLLVQGVTDYAIYMLDEHGIVNSWNAGAQRIKGYAVDEVVGTHFSRFYRPEDRDRGDPGKALAIAVRDGRFESEGWRVRKDGSQFWANVVIDPIRDSANRIIGFAKITRDVTEKREAALALERTREALFQSQKLDALGQLSGGIAHDFNNLLMVILSSLELLGRRIPDDERLAKLIQNATVGAKRGVALTQRMLAFARRQELHPVTVKLPGLVDGMMDLLERSLGPTIRVEIAFEPNLPTVLVDPNQLELAILNLALNARDAMPDGGTLVISAREDHAADESGKTPIVGRSLRLTIADTGAGMDAATLARATEPFFTTKGVGKGTGLGLPMVYGLATQSGGRFALTSTLGQGTTAELWLPLASAEQTVERAPASAIASAPSTVKPLRVLAVDDDSLVLTNTVSMLEELGHSVLQAGSGEAALTLLSRDEPVDLLITDQAMPDMSGLQLIDALRHRHSRLPVILATGFLDFGAAPAAVVSRLTKPFDQQELATAISAAMAMTSTRDA